MLPHISPNRGGHRGVRTSRGGYPGGAPRGSQFGSPLSINTSEKHAATPLETTPNPQVDHSSNDPSSYRGQQPDDRSRGRGRGRGIYRGGAPASSISLVISSPITTENVSSASLSQSPSDRDMGAAQLLVSTPSFHINSPSSASTLPASLVFRGQSAGHRGRGRGRGSTIRGAAPGSSSRVQTTPVIATVPISKTASTVSFTQSGTFRGQSSSGRGGHRFLRGGGGGASGPLAIMGSPSGMPGKSYYPTR